MADEVKVEDVSVQDRARASAQEAQAILAGPVGDAERARATGLLVHAIGELTAELDAAKPATKSAAAKHDDDEDDDKKPAKRR